jgi:hypothetical protein
MFMSMFVIFIQREYLCAVRLVFTPPSSGDPPFHEHQRDNTGTTFPLNKKKQTKIYVYIYRQWQIKSCLEL